MKTMSISALCLLGALPASVAQQRKGPSILEIIDTKDGSRRVVREFPGIIEAPNWTPDGKWLVYNSGGRLYKISPDQPGDPVPIDTGSADKCNNDHVLSADGRQIAISNLTEGKSRIYTVPFAGGTPVQITPNAPSYAHGWSPDGRTIAYCAERGGSFDVYTIPATGGEEKRLTTAEGLDDGPEYSPDGKYIWFNSVRTGLMQVWRMKADGSGQTQMTFHDDRNSWFPHLSPDGKQVVYIAYHKGDLAPGEHLADKNVELWLMPAAGGAPRLLAELFGGQGSLNVNSWAPDSRRLAFVSYRKDTELSGDIVITPIKEVQVEKHDDCGYPIHKSLMQPGERKFFFSGSTDVGACKIPGRTQRGQLEIIALTGSGANMWGAADACRFAWLEQEGDFSITTSVTFPLQSQTPHRKAGIMVRESLEADSPAIFIAVHGEGLTCLQYRETKGGAVKSIDLSNKAPGRMQLSRRGNVFTMKMWSGNGWSDGGTPPEKADAEVTLELPAKCYVGLYVCAHDNERTETVHFSKVALGKIKVAEGGE